MISYNQNLQDIAIELSILYINNINIINKSEKIYYIV